MAKASKAWGPALSRVPAGAKHLGMDIKHQTSNLKPQTPHRTFSICLSPWPPCHSPSFFSNLHSCQVVVLSRVVFAHCRRSGTRIDHSHSHSLVHHTIFTLPIKRTSLVPLTFSYHYLILDKLLTAPANSISEFTLLQHNTSKHSTLDPVAGLLGLPTLCSNDKALHRYIPVIVHTCFQYKHDFPSTPPHPLFSPRPRYYFISFLCHHLLIPLDGVISLYS